MLSNRFANTTPDTEDLRVLALVKGSERYVLLFTTAHRAEAINTLGRWASNYELSFTWYDAAVLAKRIREQEQESERKR